MRRFALAAIAVGCVFAQRGVDWVIGANDAHRSSWVRMDSKISSDSMQKPGFGLLWKMKMNGTARQMNSLTPPSLLDFYISYRGFRSLAFVGMASGTVTAVDIDLARLEWEKSFAQPAGAGTVACPGGITSGVVRVVNSINYPSPMSGSGIGRGTPAKSGAGLPDEGAVTLKMPPAPRPGPPPAAKPRPGVRASEPVNMFAPRIQYAYFLTGDGKFHFLYVSNGDEPNPPIDFLPPGAHAQGLIVFEKVAYVTTVNGCGGVANGLWALDLETRKVSHWKASSGVASGYGPAFGPDGTVYVAGTDELVALELKTLAVKGRFKPGGLRFTSSPTVFEFKGKDMIAVTTNDGALHVIDAANLTKPAASTPAFAAKDYATGGVASWQDMSGGRWILAPTGKAIAAWKVVATDGGVALEAAWTSPEMVTPVTPLIVNGVVFALGSGEFRTSDTRMTAAQRAAKSAKAVLYSLDANTGKELWNSGTTIDGFVTTGRLAAGGGRVYVGANDGTQYAFGIGIEH